MKKILLPLLVLCACHDITWAQSFDKDYKLLQSGSIVQDKNFYLFTVMQQVPELRKALREDQDCKAFLLQKASAITLSLQRIDDSLSFLSMYQYTADDIERARQVVGKLWSVNKSFRAIAGKHLRPSGYFMLFAPFTDSLMLMQSLSEGLTAVNSIINTYGLGRKGMNAAIDSVSYNVRSAHYKSVLLSNAKIATGYLDTMKLFFEPAMNMSLSLLNLNNRDEAARFEPMISGENNQAYKKIKHIKWQEYKYSAILVPGYGPEDNHSLDPIAKLRINLAVDRYRKKLAPFIIVSGGFVHPFQTPFCEAIEMKKELMKAYAVPESDIIIEPHARHTTTNIRNANRLVFRYGLPTDKPVLLTTSADQSLYIQAELFKNRCLADMGHVPFKNLVRTSPYDLEYMPVESSLHMKSSDPLDP